MNGPSNGQQNSRNSNSRRHYRPRKQNKNNQELPSSSDPQSNNIEASSSNPHSPHHPRNRNRPSQRVVHADPQRVVQRPQPKNPRGLTRREQEIEQLRRGMSHMIPRNNEQTEHASRPKFTNATEYEIKLKPSDPDFAFDINNLEFILYVPSNYPSKTPSISVTNTDIPRQYSLNVDLGFKEMAVEGLRVKSLLDLINDLDKNLEDYLKREKRPTIKIVKFKGGSSKPANISDDVNPADDKQANDIQSLQQDLKEERIIPPEVIAERSKQINQVIHRLGTDVFEYVGGDDNETIYNLTLTPNLSPDPSFFSSLLPREFDQKLNVMLQIPKGYYLEPCSIIITSVLDDSTNISLFPISTIEANFNKSAMRNTHWTLLTHINFLVTRLGKLMRSDYLEYFSQIETKNDPNGKGKVQEQTRAVEPDPVNGNKDANTETKIPANNVKESDALETNLKFSELQEKARRILMALNPSSNDTDLTQEPKLQKSVSDSQELEQHSDQDGDEEGSGKVENSGTSELPTLEPRGIALLVPGIQLTNIAILECQFLNLVVKCDRCGTQNDFLNVTPGPFGRESKPVAEECLKCKNTLAVSFNKNLIHLQGDQVEHKNDASAPVAGYLDVSGCTPFDMLASTYVATCDNCVIPNTESPFRRVERGKKVTVNCRDCHLKMTMQMGSEILFDKLSDSSLTTERLKGIRVIKQKSRNDETKQKLGISSGRPLPDEGACVHYKKSRRWYRFSCCGKIFPCDKCHNASSDHTNEHATRIVCGKCSREQNISGVCMYCRYEFQTKSTGFWEGGKGTRDPTKLNRNDTRKHKRLPKNKTGSTNSNSKGKGGNNGNKGGETRRGQNGSTS